MYVRVYYLAKGQAEEFVVTPGKWFVGASMYACVYACTCVHTNIHTYIYLYT